MLARQRNELEAVLAGLVQGVFAVDEDRKLISINDAAAQLMEVEREQVLGQPVHHVIRNKDLRQVVLAALQEEDPVEGHVVLQVEAPDAPTAGANMRFVRVQDTTLHDAHGKRIGKMVVLQDVTHLRHLEGVRRDFVANVSHEVKTPVTAIKAAAETLLDAGGLDQADALRFLRIISRQGDRLHAIVEDLLTLARIEQDVDHQKVELAPGRISDVLQVAVEACEPRANEKSIRIEKQCDPQLRIPISPHLLERAVINLLDNAVKYSPNSSDVWLTAQREDDEVCISVRDQGPGVSAEHVARLFERFYRTDKARSRELGGTGLGLAIVKHIAQAHGGRASVQSAPGEGSTFRIHLPGD